MDKIHGLLFLLIFSYPVCAIVSYYFTIKSGEWIEWLFQINLKLGLRLTYGLDALRTYGIHLRGQYIAMIGAGLDAYGRDYSSDGYNYVDNIYIYTPLMFGAVVSIVFLIIIMCLIFMYWRKKNYYLLFYWTTMAVWGMIDNHMINYYYHVFWLVAFTDLDGILSELKKFAKEVRTFFVKFRTKPMN